VRWLKRMWAVVRIHSRKDIIVSAQTKRQSEQLRLVLEEISDRGDPISELIRRIDAKRVGK